MVPCAPDIIFKTIEDMELTHPWSEIIIHHSLDPDVGIQEWNKIEAKGFHFGIVFNVHRWEYAEGISLRMDGAHCKGHDATAIGIVLVGNYNLSEVAHQQYFLLGCLCRALMRKFNIPIDKIHAHDKFEKIECPGSKFDLDKFKKEYVIQL